MLWLAAETEMILPAETLLDTLIDATEALLLLTADADTALLVAAPLGTLLDIIKALLLAEASLDRIDADEAVTDNAMPVDSLEKWDAAELLRAAMEPLLVKETTGADDEPALTLSDAALVDSLDTATLAEELVSTPCDDVAPCEDDSSCPLADKELVGALEAAESVTVKL